MSAGDRERALVAGVNGTLMARRHQASARSGRRHRMKACITGDSGAIQAGQETAATDRPTGCAIAQEFQHNGELSLGLGAQRSSLDQFMQRRDDLQRWRCDIRNLRELAL